MFVYEIWQQMKNACNRVYMAKWRVYAHRLLRRGYYYNMGFNNLILKFLKSTNNSGA